MDFLHDYGTKELNKIGHLLFLSMTIAEVCKSICIPAVVYPQNLPIQEQFTPVRKLQIGCQ